MEIKGKLIKHLPAQTGEGKNGQWQKGGFVLEFESGKFKKTIMFSTWGECVETTAQIPTGMKVDVSFDVESREYNDKYYTDAKAWKVVGSDSPVTPSKITYSKDNMPVDDLPF